MRYAVERGAQTGVIAPYDIPTYAYTYHSFATSQARDAWVAENRDTREVEYSYQVDLREAQRQGKVIHHA